jgi:hypothetical protein
MLDDLHPHGLQFAATDLVPNTPSPLSMVPSYAEDGFDDLAAAYLVMSALGNEAAVLAAHFPKGKQLTGLSMWVRRASCRGIAPGLWICEVNARGLLGSTRYERRVDAVVAQSSDPDVSLVAPEGYPFTYPTIFSVRANEATLTARTSYVTTTAPDYTKVSETVYAANPLPSGYPALPDPPVDKWSSIEDPVYHYPAGWVLEARPTEVIRNDSNLDVCWHVQDLHVYYQQKRPSS